MKKGTKRKNEWKQFQNMRKVWKKLKSKTCWEKCWECFGVDRVPVVFLWCLAALSVAWATALVYRGYWPGPTNVTLHPSRMMESSQRQPFVVGVVMSTWSRVSRYTCYLSTHTLGRERVSRCSVDSRGSCTRVLVIVVATNSSASVASPHRLVHLLLHDLRHIGNCLHIVLRVFTLSQLAESFLSPQANFTWESLRVVRILYLVTEQIWLNSPVVDVLRHARPLLLTSTWSGWELFLLPDDVQLSVGLVIGCPIISKLDDRHLPIICHVALPALNSCTNPQNVHPSLRSPSQESFGQPTWRSSCILCMHQSWDSSIACSTTCWS